MAMALDIPVADFFKLLGHDGGEIVYPMLAEPWCRAGIHPQEAIDVVWKLYRSATPFEYQPQSINFPDEALRPRNVLFREGNVERFMARANGGVGVIECVTRNHTGHAVAFGHGYIFDPDGHEYDWHGLEERGLQPIRLWRIEAR